MQKMFQALANNPHSNDKPRQPYVLRVIWKSSLESRREDADYLLQVFVVVQNLGHLLEQQPSTLKAQ
jgi:hypothetical protein